MKSISSWKWLHLYVHGGSALKKPHEERSLLWGILLSVLWFIWDNIWKVASLTVCVVDGEASMEGNTNTAQRKMENTCKRKRCLHYVQTKTLNSFKRSFYHFTFDTLTCYISCSENEYTAASTQALSCSFSCTCYIHISEQSGKHASINWEEKSWTDWELKFTAAQWGAPFTDLRQTKVSSLRKAAHDSSVLTWPSLFQIDDLTLSVSSRFVHSVCCHCVVYSLDGNEYGS